jgi:hypothetical protein
MPNNESIRRAQVRQLWEARSPQERSSETGIVNFTKWLDEHNPDLFPPGAGDRYQRLRAELIADPRTMTWAITAGAASYSCTNCSWKIEYEKQNASEAHKEFDNHVCAG